MERSKFAKYRVNDETGCWVWTGGFLSGGDGRKYPAMYFKGRAIMAAKTIWQDQRCTLPAYVQLLRVCDEVKCVSPSHYILRHPSTLCGKLGASKQELRALVQLMIARDLTDPTGSLDGFCWDSAATRDLMADHGCALSLAMPWGSDPLLIHAAYATLLLGARKKRRKAVEAEVSVVGEARSRERAAAMMADLSGEPAQAQPTGTTGGISPARTET